jgi:hypothetical protein
MEPGLEPPSYRLGHYRILASRTYQDLVLAVNLEKVVEIHR